MSRDQATAEAMATDASRKQRRFGALAWTAIIAAVALASSTLGLVFDLFPRLRPDPGTRLGADLSVFAVEPEVTQGAYFNYLPVSAEERAELRRDACDGAPGCLKHPGEVVYVRATVEGFKRRSVAMRVSLYYAASGIRVEEASNLEVATAKLDAPSDRAVFPVWIPCPPDPTTRYFARVELYHKDDGVLLAVADGAPFRTDCGL